MKIEIINGTYVITGATVSVCGGDYRPCPVCAEQPHSRHANMFLYVGKEISYWECEFSVVRPTGSLASAEEVALAETCGFCYPDEFGEFSKEVKDLAEQRRGFLLTILPLEVETI